MTNVKFFKPIRDKSKPLYQIVNEYWQFEVATGNNYNDVGSGNRMQYGVPLHLPTQYSHSAIVMVRMHGKRWEIVS